MAHKEQSEYIKSLKEKFPIFFKQKKVLEIGSYNVNGSIRTFFDNCNYTGLDLEPGNDVDVVCEGQNYDAPNETYDVVASAECFEHNPYWKETFLNMIRMCKKNGLVFFTCATDGREEHGTNNNKPLDSPFTLNKGWDYYQNLNQSHFDEFDLDEYFSDYKFMVNDTSKDLYFYGIKKGIPLSIFYHLFIPDTSGMWVWWVDEQLGLLKSSGLAENSTVNMCITMPVGLIGKIDTEKFAHVDKSDTKPNEYSKFEFDYESVVLDYIKNNYPFVNILSIRGTQEQPNLFEGHTLKHLYDYSLKNDGYVMYFHNKGMTESFYNAHGVFGEDKKWRQYMQHHCVNRWKECVAKLDEGYDCVGANYFEDFYPFAGNFWWASTKHITRLDDPLDVEKYYNSNTREKYGWDGFANSYRFAFEFWIGSKENTIDIKHYYMDVRNFLVGEYVNMTTSSMIKKETKKEEIITPKTDINLNNYMTQPKNQKFNLVRIVPDNHFSIHSSVFHEIEASVFFALQRMGFEVSNTVNKFKTDARNIVFGMHHCPVDVVRHDIPKDTIIYSLEQMRDAPECIRWCRKYRGLEVWDYSMRNVEVLRKAGVENIKHCKIGYVPELSYFERNRPEDRDIDILAYMYVSERRNKILEQFSNDKNINFVHIQSVYGDDRDAYIKRAKLVINIHNHENQIFEMVRVSHAIQNKIPVLAERNPTTDFPSYMEGTIYTTPYDNFVSKAYELIKNPAQMDRDAEKALEVFKKSPMENFLKEVLQ